LKRSRLAGGTHRSSRVRRPICIDKCVYNELSLIEMEFDCSGFDWDDGNRKKCEKHGLSIYSIESLFERPVAIFPAPEHSSQEDRFVAIGKTDDGRSVLIAFTLRKSDEGMLLRPISARYMHKKEIDHYEKEASQARK
jgi:uncharacterized DUF497 family protein